MSPKRRQDYAVVEFDFIRFDPRYRALPADEAQAFIHLWVTCVHLRRDAFAKGEIEGPMLPDMAGVDAECFARMVASATVSGLLSRGPGGRVTVDGVKTKHDALRWPIADPKKPLCGPSVSGDEMRGDEKKSNDLLSGNESTDDGLALTRPGEGETPEQRKQSEIEAINARLAAATGSDRTTLHDVGRLAFLEGRDQMAAKREWRAAHAEAGDGKAKAEQIAAVLAAEAAKGSDE